ncbi:unnamed protein product, partial [Mesorhabditis belari]|uniref:HhH-GPD domain-containing protein n=1 Tax=Mesorhabditis belari TaxID=2138241 RepID=A0AAF3FDL7_9BILA
MKSGEKFAQNLKEFCKRMEIAGDSESLSKLAHKQLAQIAEMRQSFEAPVDTMGCHCLHDSNADIQDQHFQTLVGGVLSPQTKDEITAAAMKRFVSKGCTIKDVCNQTTDEIEELIKPVGFYKRKAVFVKKAAELLKSDYNYVLPNSVKELCKFPGVGPKIANMVVQIAYDNTEGVVVDTHVERISKRLGWANETDKATDVAIKVQDIFSRDLWPGINRVLVGFGQKICKAPKPDCDACACSHLCPSANKKATNTVKTISPIDIEDCPDLRMENGTIVPIVPKPNRKRKSSDSSENIGFLD